MRSWLPRWPNPHPDRNVVKKGGKQPPNPPPPPEAQDGSGLMVAKLRRSVIDAMTNPMVEVDSVDIRPHLVQGSGYTLVDTGWRTITIITKPAKP